MRVRGVPACSMVEEETRGGERTTGCGSAMCVETGQAGIGHCVETCDESRARTRGNVFEKTEDKQIFAKWKEFISSGIPNEVQTNFEKELDQTLKQRYFDIRNQPLIEGYKENVKLDLKYW